MGPLSGTIISTLLPMLGQLFGNWQNSRSVEETNNANIQAQQQINEQNIASQERINQQNLEQQWKMWQATNDYNHPAAQMLRYKEAGLNPNLIYGQSNTTQAATVGTSQAAKSSAPIIQAKRYQNIMQGLDISRIYYQALKDKEEAQSVQLDNDIKRNSLDDLKKQAGLQNELVASQISNIQKDIELKGLDYVYKSLHNELQRFEVDQIPTLRRLAENRLSLSNSQVDLIPIIKAKEEAGLKLTNIQIRLGYSQYLLNEAQTEHELAKIGVTKQQKENLLKQYEKMEKEIVKLRSDIDFNEIRNNYYNSNSTSFLGGGVFQDFMKFIDNLDYFHSGYRSKYDYSK